MKNVISSFPDLWPASRREQLRPYLDGVQVLIAPLPKMMSPSIDTKKVIVVMEKSEVRDAMRVLERGFEHVIQRERPDFAQEILASCLMIQRPKVFAQNPVGFFLNGLNSAGQIDETQKHMVVDFSSSDDKQLVMGWLSELLGKDKRTRHLQDAAMQIADEMVSNALFNAPVDMAGKRLFQDKPRTASVRYPDKKKPARLFGHFNDNKLLIGCEDPYGTIRRPGIFSLLSEAYSDGPITLRTEGAASGAGLRLMVDNAANFCIYCETGKRTVVACALLLENMKSNYSTHKHFHISIR